MSKSETPDIRKVILTWLEKDQCPIEIDTETKKEIAKLCIDEGYSKNREKFRKGIEKIVSDSVQNHIRMGGGK